MDINIQIDKIESDETFTGLVMVSNETGKPIDAAKSAEYEPFVSCVQELIDQ